MRFAPLAPLTAATLASAAVTSAPEPPQGAPATCRHQSSAGFRESPRDLVVGPLVLVGAREYSSPALIARLGGQKYPALVLAGHRVTVELPRGVRRTSLLYADDHWKLPDGERTVRDGHRVVAFHACTTARAASSYDGRDATFWSGFVLTTVPRCLRLRVWVDEERTPRSASIPLGKRCARQAPRSWAQQAYSDLIHVNEVDRGGHFAAWEQPERFASELRAGFRSLR